jgi:D-alanyl-D-alanine carboxypeptidase
MKLSPKKVHIDIFVVYGLAVCVIFAVFLSNTFKKTVKEKKVLPSVVVTKKQPVPMFNKKLFENVVIEGKAYVVYDALTHEIIASKNEKEVLPLASITKVMTALSATRHMQKDAPIIISAKSIEGNYDLGLKEKQTWKLSELLKYTLVFSSNDGAEAVADSFGGRDIFVAQMNSDAQSLGLNLSFTDPAGRDLNGAIGGKGTVVDAARLFIAARASIPEILDATTKKRETVFASSGRISGVPNTNQSIESLSGAEASKTGYTDKAGGNLGVVVDVSIGHPVVIVVLGSTREGRFRDMSVLYNALRKSINNEAPVMGQ